MIIIHGEDSNKSYQRLISLTEELQNKQFEVITHDIQELEITLLRQELGSSGLFGSSKCFVFKNILSSNKSKNKDKIIETINLATSHEIIIWENKAVSVSALKSFPQAKVESFAISPVIFKFLDSLRPGNTKNILLSWKKMQEEGIEPEFVFAMLVRQIKLLLQAKSGPGSLKLAPYPARLITTQSAYFTEKHLLDLYKRLYDIDEKIKTGTGSAPLDQLIGHFLQKI